MIEEIVEMILKEARSKKGYHLVVKIYEVHNEIDRKIGEIVKNLEEEERRLRDEDKGGDS